MSINSDGHMPGWQGLTIKEILEKVDLFNISTLVEDDKKGCDEDGEKVITVMSWLNQDLYRLYGSWVIQT